MVLSELESSISYMPISCGRIYSFKASCLMRIECSKVQPGTVNVILYIQAKKTHKTQKTTQKETDCPYSVGSWTQDSVQLWKMGTVTEWIL